MSESVRAVDRALAVLACFTNNTPELTLTQISEQVGINKSTVHRLLATLERQQFLERDSQTGVYRPGIRLLQLANLALENNNLRRLASPFLRHLCDLHRENVNLAVLDGAEVVYTEVIEGAQRVKLAAVTGQKLPAFGTASGKAILAYLPEETVKQTLERGVPQYTEQTLSSPALFLEDMQHTRERGFAISEQEFEDGINAVAAPIFNGSHQPIASISVAGPAYRIPRERMMEIGPSLVDTADKIAQELKLATRLK
jgi:IclR family transcriptional regulator, KDG regulon repressor